MQTLESLKRSIASAEDLGSVVRTMKAMAAVSIRQYETATESLTEYARTIDTGLAMLMRHTCDDFSESTANGRTGAVVFGSDQGMCGQFNEQVAQFAMDSLLAGAEEVSQQAPVICVGQRVADKLSDANFGIHHTFSLPGSVDGITPLVQELLAAIDGWRARYSLQRISVFHNRRLTSSSWQPHVMQLLPLNIERLKTQHDSADSHSVPPENDSTSAPHNANRSLPLWTMDSDVLFSRLVKQFLFVSLFQACAESLAGENASRIAAMQAAERNINDRLQELRSDFSRQRQTTITEELLDVVTGYEALTQG